MSIRRLLALALLICVGCGKEPPAAPTPKRDAARGPEFVPNPLPNKRPAPVGPQPKHAVFDEATVKAWGDYGFVAGWMGESDFSVDPKKLKDPFPAFLYPQPTGDDGTVNGTVRLPFDAECLKYLPPVGVPFGLYMRPEGLTRPIPKSDCLKAIAGLKNLTRLNLSLTELGLDNAEPKELAGMKELTWLDISGTSISDAGLKDLRGLQKLTYLNATLIRITDPGVQHISELTELEVLRLESHSLTEAGLQHLAGLKELKRLELTSSKTTKVTVTGWKHLAGCKKLTTLRVVGHFTDAGIKELASLKSLKSLDLKFTQVNDATVKELQEALPDCKIEK